jgi:hypothetical protein
MGSSAAAILFYGYLWDDDECTAEIGCAIHGVNCDEYDPDEHDADDWDEVILGRRGVGNPWVACPEDDRMIDAWKAANRAILDAFWASKEAVRPEFGVVIGRHGVSEEDAPHLAIDGTAQCVVGRHGLAVTPEMLAVGSDWKARLDRWLAEFGIAPPQAGPQWWIVAEYG